jgi:hypothetical protein
MGESQQATPHRVRLLRAGVELDHNVHDVRGIVSVKTSQQWFLEVMCWAG